VYVNEGGEEQTGKNERETIKIFRRLLWQRLQRRTEKHGHSGNSFHFEGDSNVEIWPKLILNT
jgi:hypothetical protein